LTVGGVLESLHLHRDLWHDFAELVGDAAGDDTSARQREID